jgi:hypothetical protein
MPIGEAEAAQHLFAGDAGVIADNIVGAFGRGPL